MNDQPEVKKQKLNLAQKLIEIRKSVDYVKKDTKGHNYSYASGTVVIGALKKKMNELGVLLEPNVIDKEVIYRTVKTKNGEREVITVQANMEMVWVDADTGDERGVSFACFGTQDDISKAFGSALTYSERFFLLKYFNIPTDNIDPDSFQRKAEDTTVDTTPKKTLPDYTTDVETINTVDGVNEWLKANWGNATNDLSDMDQNKLKSHVTQWREGLEPKKTAPEFVNCPNLKKEMPLADCKLSECFAKCNVANPK